MIVSLRSYRPGCEQHDKNHVSVTSSYNMQYKYNKLNNVCTNSADSAAKVIHTHKIKTYLRFRQESWTNGYHNP